MKIKWKKIVSGMLMASTLISMKMQLITVSAAELEKIKRPLYEEVRKFLDTDEVVITHDYEMEVGPSFESITDFLGIEILDNQKVKVSFEEAANEQGEAFDSSYVDTYKVVYYVESQRTEHLTYQVSRKLMVREPVTEEQTTETEKSETFLDETSEEVETQDAYDEERGITSGMLWNQIIEDDVDIFAIEEEIVEQVAQPPQGWNRGIFNMIQNLSNLEILSIAGMIITFVLCYGLISMIAERNNMHDIDIFMFFKYFIKIWISVYLVSNSFTIG